VEQRVVVAITHTSAFLLGAAIFGVLLGFAGLFVGYDLAHSGRPALLVRNLTGDEVTEVVVLPHGAARRSVERLPPRGSERIQLSGQEQSIRITATMAAGKRIESDWVYVTPDTLVFAAILHDVIAIELTNN
jgi:hypothetical protein